MKGQKATVLRLLRQRGSRGVSAHDLVYVHGITRGAAVIHELRKEAGIEIETLDEGNGQLATYILKEAVRPPVPLCGCGHVRRHHVADRRCMEDVNAGSPIAPVVQCVCERYDAGR